MLSQLFAPAEWGGLWLSANVCSFLDFCAVLAIFFRFGKNLGSFNKAKKNYKSKEPFKNLTKFLNMKNYFKNFRMYIFSMD